ncbi:MAG: hypothetical protein ABW173_08520 [Sphingomonas sp.]
MIRIAHAATLAALLPAAFALAPAPVVAQANTFPTITVFGADACPRDTICVRAAENERYRIPKELRGESGLALAERWGDRARSIEYTGANGTQSCSPVGAGGASGCFKQIVRQAREESRERGQEPSIPLDLP